MNPLSLHTLCDPVIAVGAHVLHSEEHHSTVEVKGPSGEHLIQPNPVFTGTGIACKPGFQRSDLSCLPFVFVSTLVLA